ncbi:MAG TPA: ring-cleaving dioxygenase [Flavitalea sp.]|nr:ring-cleaving dioxygenase [Flavitalea sp.]
MENRILGLHHITAIAGNAQKNYNFYTKVLGLRLVKKTVNFDDPGTYHFYFGDEVGTPGTILTFFPWEGIRKGISGTGMATEIGYAIPEGSFSFWQKKLAAAGVRTQSVSHFDAAHLLFQDPDGLFLSLSENGSSDGRAGWTADPEFKDHALKGFQQVTLTLKSTQPTAEILTNLFGYELKEKAGNRTRYETSSIGTANIVDLVELPTERPGHVAGGSTHHVAFRVRDESTLMHLRTKVEDMGLSITPKIDRNYFFSLYFREPGGVLFEIATDNPGFAVDEAVDQLGSHLKLPAQYEESRSEIEKVLPQII